MTKFCRIFGFLLLCLGPVLAQAEDTTTTKTDTTPEVNYWRFQFFLRLQSAPFSRHVETFLPRSTDSQEILSLRRYAPEYTYRENFDGPNLKGFWTSRPESGRPDWVIYDVAAKLTPQLKPKKLIPSTEVVKDDNPITLSPESTKLLDEKIIQLGIKDQTIQKKIRILFDFVRNSIELVKDGQKREVALILESNKGDVADKNFLFRALTSRLGVPTRVVNGVLLKDRQVKNSFHQWTELYLNDKWLDFDVNDDYFASLPGDHFILYYGDEPPMTVSKGVGSEFNFVIGKISEETALDPSDLGIPQDDLFDKDYFKSSGKSESYVKNAIGRIAIITEDAIEEFTREKISKQAKESRTKIQFYSAPYESHFFRGTYIAKILAQNFDSLTETDAIFIQSEDDASLYALFRMARNNKKMKRTSIFLNGDFSQPVADILGYALYKLIKPKDLFIIKEHLSADRAWDLLQTTVLDGQPAQIAADKLKLPLQDLSKSKMENFTSWRQFLIRTWNKAAEAEVNLESIYLVLILPIIALVIVVFRNIIGFETFGTFSPILVSVAFLTTGLFWGILLFGLIVVTGVVFRILFRKIHIHLVARMAMLIAVVGLTMLVIIILGVHWNWGALVNVSILPMVIMAGIVENFTRTQMEMGTKEALRLTVSTLMASIISYFIIDVAGIQSLVLVFPEVTLVALLFEIIIGRWNGIRFSEYLRFYKIIGPESTQKSVN